MDIDLNGNVAIVTGASRGIGREIALAFARARAAVVLASRSRPDLEELARAIESGGGQAMVAPTDVTDEGAVRQLAAQTLEAFKRVDVLVNGHGINYVSSLVKSDTQRWREVLDVNLGGVFLCTKAFLRPMIRAKRGRIISIASISGKTGVSYRSSYAASKAAVIGFTKSVALEVASLGITVNAICPGPVETDMTRASAAVLTKMFGNEDYDAKSLARSPQKRMITTQEIAALTVFLASPEAAGINGQSINQCGGIVMD